MKFQELKKKKFIIHFDWFYNEYGEHYGTIICQNEGLYGMAEWEYDNGLYTESGYYDLNLTWKDIKHNLSHYKLRSQKEHRNLITFGYMKVNAENVVNQYLLKNGKKMILGVKNVKMIIGC